MTIRLPKDLQKDLARLSKQQHRSASEIVRESLRRFIAQERLRDLRSRLRPYAQANGFRTDEDVFKAVS